MSYNYCNHCLHKACDTWYCFQQCWQNASDWLSTMDLKQFNMYTMKVMFSVNVTNGTLVMCLWHGHPSCPVPVRLTQAFTQAQKLQQRNQTSPCRLLTCGWPPQLPTGATEVKVKWLCRDQARRKKPRRKSMLHMWGRCSWQSIVAVQH